MPHSDFYALSAHDLAEAIQLSAPALIWHVKPVETAFMRKVDVSV
jgi:hypothetical protein